MIRKRAPGAGRKRLGASVARNLTIRIDDEMRGQLEAAVEERAQRKRNWNLSQEILYRLGESLRRERDERRDPAGRTFGRLVAQIIYLIGSGNLEDRQRDWRTDPYAFRAVASCLTQLFVELEPSGELVLPTDGPFRRKSPDETGAVVATMLLIELKRGGFSDESVPDLGMSDAKRVENGR
jgi:hypothetical protein